MATKNTPKKNNIQKKLNAKLEKLNAVAEKANSVQEAYEKMKLEVAEFQEKIKIDIGMDLVSLGESLGIAMEEVAPENIDKEAYKKLLSNAIVESNDTHSPASNSSSGTEKNELASDLQEDEESDLAVSVR